MVGDPQQLHAIEAGAAFRSIHERHCGVEIGQVRKQREDWQRDATCDLATGRIGAAIDAYEAQGMVRQAATRDDARSGLVERWDRDRQTQPEASRIILTHTTTRCARSTRQHASACALQAISTKIFQVEVERGARAFASGDRIMFLREENQ